MIPFAELKTAYEAWLAKQLGDELVATDLAAKSDAMRESAFVFLRATYWRWAEVIPEICPDLMSAPPVLAVGDIHLENYGTWRDREGRLVWGVNDFDEAAEMPYTLDLARLSTSATWHAADEKQRQTQGKAILKGYADGLAHPGPILLDRDGVVLAAQSDGGQEKGGTQVLGQDRCRACRRKSRERPATAALRQGISVQSGGPKHQFCYCSA